MNRRQKREEKTLTEKLVLVANKTRKPLSRKRKESAQKTKTKTTVGKGDSVKKLDLKMVVSGVRRLLG